MRRAVNIDFDNPYSILLGYDPSIVVGAVSKYTQTVTLNAGVDTDITTTLTTEPYIINLYDNLDNDITSSVLSYLLVGGVYHIYCYSVVELVGCKLKIIY